MTNRKISALTAATNLVGSIFSIVQGGINKQAPVAVLDERFGQTVVSAVDPQIGDDSADGYHPGTRWINTASLNEFVCISNAAGAARWRHIPRILGASGVAVPHTGNLTETRLAEVPIPAGSMGIAGTIDVVAYWSNNNSGNNKLHRVYIGDVGAAVGTLSQMDSGSQTVNLGTPRWVRIINRGVTNAQIGGANGGSGGWSSSTGAFQTASRDTTAQLAVSFWGTLANAGDTVTLESYCVTLLRPDIAP